MILLIDMDGTVVDFISSALRKAEDIWNIKIDESEVADYKFERIVRKKLNEVNPGLGDEYTSWEIYQALTLNDPRLFFQTLAPYKDAIESLVTLKKMGHQIVFLTKTTPPHGEAMSGKLAWLERYIKPRLEYDIVFVIDTKTKALVAGDVVVDDDPRVFKAFWESEAFSPIDPLPTMICVARPWNQEFRNNHPEIPVIYNLKNLVKSMEKI